MVGEFCAGEGGEEGEGLQLVGGLRARHVLHEVGHRVRVVEAPGQTAAVGQAELE